MNFCQSVDYLTLSQVPCPCPDLVSTFRIKFEIMTWGVASAPIPLACSVWFFLPHAYPLDAHMQVAFWSEQNSAQPLADVPLFSDQRDFAAQVSRPPSFFLSHSRSADLPDPGYPSTPCPLFLFSVQAFRVLLIYVLTFILKN